MADYQAVVERFRKAMFEQHDPKAASEVYAEDAVLVDPTTSGPVRGRKAIEQNLALYVRAFPGLTAEIRNVFGSGEWFAGEMVTRGTHAGPLELAPGQTIPPTGKQAEVPIAWICRLNADGLITEDHTYYDLAGFMEQLGLSGQEARAA